MKNTVIVMVVAGVAIIGAVIIAPILKPNNSAFALDKPSSHISKRLKGIFKGMGDGFSK